jgi:esterase/lipase superfamily enzyme
LDIIEGEFLANEAHIDWLSTGYRIWNDRRKLVSFTPDLSGFDFADLPSGPSVNFRRFDFSNANLSGSNMARLDFSRARFDGANLSGATLTDSNFSGARFDRADLSRSTLAEANFAGARLLDANLSEVDARGAVFFDAVLAGARFEGARVDGAVFDISALPSGVLSTQQINMSRDVSADSIAASKDLVAHYQSAPPRFGDSSGEASSSAKMPTYLVLFATDRKPVGTRAAAAFGSDRDDGLHYGAAQVFVPESHKVGSLGSPLYKRLFAGDDRLKIRRLIELDEDLHWRFVDETFSSSRGASPLTVLIHGYKTSFEDAVLWAAQVGNDLGMERGVSLFSWPSQGTKGGYFADEATVEESKHHLAKYLVDYVANTEGPINIIAHSMGCRCLVGALEIIGLSEPEQLKRLGQIILAAADVDQGAMKKSSPHLSQNSGRTTVYACGEDNALAMSGWMHKFARVGLLPPVFLYEHLDTIEVSKGEILDWGHSYVSKAKPILSDMFQLIAHSTEPAQRFSIKPVNSPQGAYWRLAD